MIMRCAAGLLKFSLKYYNTLTESFHLCEQILAVGLSRGRSGGEAKFTLKSGGEVGVNRERR
jgi:ribosome-associated protein YbcJ (S4-like RNA binding protein)